MSHTPSEPTTHSSPGEVNEKMLSALRDVRFRMVRRSTAGYDVASVDEFVDEMEANVRAGEPVLRDIQVVRFAMARRISGGYDVGDVDAFLDQLEHLAGEKGDALEMANVPLPDDRAPWLRATNPVLWLAALAIVLVIVLYFL